MGSLILSISLLAAAITPASAQNLRLISDEETEQLLAQITQPLFKAAGQPFNRNEIYIVEDNSLNAFVADGNNLFIHTGTIVAADSPGELSGVIAHETGHISGGHILRQKLKSQSLQEVSLASAILAGAAAAVSGRGDVAMAAMIGGQSSILTHYTRYRTEEERSADETAIKLLDKTQQSPKGMLTFMKRIAASNRMQGIEETPYFRSHPVTTERVSFFEDAVKNSNLPDQSPLQDSFERVKAKLYAYLNTPQQTLRKYPTSNTKVPARYARAIAYFKQLQLARAQKELDDLIADEPNNPYFHELKGQIYLETGKIKPAKAEYKKASKLLPGSALLQISYAQAILEDEPSTAETQEAVNMLNQSVIKHPTGFAWLLLARAYGLQNNAASANYASAEYSLRIGALETARDQLQQAKKAKPDARLSLKIGDLEARVDGLLKKTSKN